MKALTHKLASQISDENNMDQASIRIWDEKV